MAEKTSIQDQFYQLENDKAVYCRYHKQETYQLYCKDCRDFVCFECLDEKHPTHSFCRLRNADNDIMNELKTLLTTKIQGNGCITFIKDKLEETITKLIETECELKVKIETSAKNMMNNIQMSKSQLLSSVSDIFSEYTKEIREAQQQAEDLSSVTACFDEERLNKLAFLHVVKVLADLKHCLAEGNKTFDQYHIPSFKPNSPQPVGYICKAVDAEKESEFDESDESSKLSQKLSMCKMLTVFTQTDDNMLEDSDTECEWFDAEDIPGECFNENSSDEIRDVFPFQLNLENSTKLVHKIIPVSETDAWILTDRKLRKITGHTLDGVVYLENVDDIAIINKGDVLILRKDNDFIMRFLPDKRLVRFWGIDHVKTPALCLCVTENDSIIVCLGESDPNVYGQHIIQIDKNGVEVWRTFYLYVIYNSPYIVLSKQSDLCLIYRSSIYSKCTLHLRKANISSRTNISSYSYTGVFGFEPGKNFLCHGMCTDSTGNILVSDHLHHIVYTLDNNLKFKKCIVDARDGLNSPAAIALHGNRLWVADGQHVLIFEYNDNALEDTKTPKQLNV